MALERYESKKNEMGKVCHRFVDGLERTVRFSRTLHVVGRSRVSVLELNAHV